MRSSAVAYAACCALAFTACGSDDSASDRAGRPTGAGERQWAERVNRVCRENNAAARRLVAQLRSEGLSGTEFVAETLERTLPLQRRWLSELRSITAPAALRPEFDRFLDRLEDSLPLIERLATSARTRRTDPGLNTQLQRVVDDTRPFAQEHGLAQCLQGGR